MALRGTGEVLMRLRKPSRERVQSFLARQASLPHSYPEVGTECGEAPRGYVMDHHRVQLGQGGSAFERAKAALLRWEMFRTGWLELCWPDTPIEAGSPVALLARVLGVWTLSACRVVRRIEADGVVETFGFSYGTLPDHPLRGEERFVLEWRHEDDSVWYDLRAFSRPKSLLSWLAYPLVRHLQRRFAEHSMRAMWSAAQGQERH